MNNKFFYFIFFLVLISNVLSNYNLGTKNHLLHELKIINNLQSDSIKAILHVLENENMIPGEKVKDCLVTNIQTNEKVRMNSLLNYHLNSNILIRLIETSCSSCIKNQIEILKGLQDFDNLIVLSGESNARLLRLFLNDINMKPIVYQIENAGRLFKGDNIAENLILYVDNNGTILRAFLLEEKNLYLIKNIIPRKLQIQKS